MRGSALRKTLALLFSSAQTIMLALVACGGAPAVGDLSTTPPGSVPEGRIAASPLAILTSAGSDTLVRRPGAADWTPGKAGMTLGQGYVVKTGAAPASITLFEGSTIELDGSTEVDLSELDVGQEAATTVRLKQEIGKTISRVKKLADPAARYEIETPAAVAAVRGTTMLVEVAQDGTTLVGNVEGLVAVLAQGVEVELPPGTHSMVSPGQPPSAPLPGTSGPLPAPPGSTASPTGSTAPPVSPGAPELGIAISVMADRRSVFAGDTITYAYSVSNTGTIPLSNVSVADGKAGLATLEGGDANGNNSLDAGETWAFTARYTAVMADVGQVRNSATASGSAQGQTTSASAGTGVEVVGLTVKIASLTQGALVGRSVVVSGTVNDPSAKEVTLTLNGNPRSVAVANGSFTATVELAAGINTITVSVNKAGGVSASDTVVLEPANPQA